MKLTLTRSAVIDAPLDGVWAVLRDFNSLAQWHPAVADNRIENSLDGDVVGCVRRLRLEDGAELREQLLLHSDRDHTLSYSILDASLPLFDAVTTLALKPVTDGGRTFWHWRTQCRVPDDRGAELEALLGRRMAEEGFSGLRRFLAEPAPTTRLRPETVETLKREALTGGSLPATAVVVTATGPPEVMALRPVTVDAPGPGQVRLRQTAAAVNRIDIEHRRGTRPGMELPITPGLEGVGEIIDAGPQVHGLYPGDRVVYLSRTPGAYTDIRCIDADACLPLGEEVSDGQASLLFKGVTAGVLFDRVLHAAEGATVMIQAVSDGLGHLLAQWAGTLGLVVIGTVADIEAARFSRENGCHHPIVSTETVSFTAEVMRITNGRGVDYWIHRGGIPGLVEALACLARRGHCAVIDEGDGALPSLDLDRLRRRSLTVSALSPFDYLHDRLYLQRLALQLFTRLRNRTLTPAVETFPLSRAAEAHQRIETGQTMGAAVLAPSVQTGE